MTRFLNDLHADIGNSYSEDSTSNGNELQGNLQQLYQMKESNRHLKTMLSIGGYTLSPHFVAILHPSPYVLSSLAPLSTLCQTLASAAFLSTTKT
jgi:hypothetical protein